MCDMLEEVPFVCGRASGFTRWGEAEEVEGKSKLKREEWGDGEGEEERDGDVKACFI